MITIKRYGAKDKELWDNFVKQSKNGSFLFMRDYMGYHSDRFEDFSLIFFCNNKLVALLPANINYNYLASHEGLTYGGIITNHKMKMNIMLQIFDSLKAYLKSIGIKKLLYKPIPHIYHLHPAEEDLYALFVNNAVLIRRDVSSTIEIGSKIPFSKGRKKNIKKAENKGFNIKRSHDFTTFMDLKEEQLLKKYGLKPTHSAEEMEYLANKFPENIKLFTSEQDGKVIDGVLIYENKNVIHVQYQGATEHGIRLRAPDLIFDQIINYYSEKKYFDFGISTEEGYYLNKGLIDFKERFGARAVVYDTYEINL